MNPPNRVRSITAGRVVPPMFTAVLSIIFVLQGGCAPARSERPAVGPRLFADGSEPMRSASDKVRLLYGEMVRLSQGRPASNKIMGVMYVGCIGLDENLDTYVGGGPAGPNGGRGDSYCIEAPHDLPKQSDIASLWQYSIGADELHAFRSDLLLWRNGRWMSAEQLMGAKEIAAKVKALRKVLGIQ